MADDLRNEVKVPESERYNGISLGFVGFNVQASLEKGSLQGKEMKNLWQIPQQDTLQLHNQVTMYSNQEDLRNLGATVSQAYGL